MLKPIIKDPQPYKILYEKKNMKTKPIEKICEINPYKNKQNDFSNYIINKGKNLDKTA